MNQIHDALGIEPVAYDSEGLWVYHIPTSLTSSQFIFQKSSQFISLGSGFYGLENSSGTPTRWMQADATIVVNSSENRTATLSLNVLSFYRNRTLEVSTGGMPAMRVAVPTSFINLSAPIHLLNGTNTLSLHVPEGCDRPCDKSELNNPDTRCLSLTVQNLTLT